MKLIVNYKLGLAFSGTKHGRMVFFTLNIDESLEHLSNEMVSLRKIFPSQLEDYYFFNVSDDKILITQAHFIKDFANRGGYFAMTLFFPPFYLMEESLIIDCFNEIMKVYKENYFIEEHDSEKIDVNKREDSNLFQPILDKYSQKLVKSNNKFSILNKTEKKTNCIFTYNNDIELFELLKIQQRKELLEYDMIFLMPKSNVSKLPNDDDRYKISSLPPLRKDSKITIWVQDANNGDALYNVKVRITGNKGLDKEIICDSSETVEIESTISNITISASAEGYITEEESVQIKDEIDETLLIKLTAKPKPQTKDESISNSKKGSFKYPFIPPSEEEVNEHSTKPTDFLEKYAFIIYGILAIIFLVIIGGIIKISFSSGGETQVKIDSTKIIDSITLNQDSANEIPKYNETYKKLDSFLNRIENIKKPNELNAQENSLNLIKKDIDILKYEAYKTNLNNKYKDVKDSLATKGQELIVESKTLQPEPTSTLNNLEDLKTWIKEHPKEIYDFKTMVKVLRSNINTIEEYDGFHQWLISHQIKYPYAKSIINYLDNQQGKNNLNPFKNK